MNKKNYLIIVVGPTAIGKTALAIELAKYFNTEITSCDSRQFYKEMEIGTAVPNSEELNAAKHYFIQNKSIHNNYNVGDYEREVLPHLDALFQQNNIQIVVGGSGLYVDAILKGFDSFPDVDENIRTEIEQKYDELGIEYLQNQLEKFDPEYYQKLNEENPQTLVNQQRMKRFVGVSMSSGKPYSSFLNKNEGNRNFTPILIGLEADREEMYERINKRVDIMMLNGLLKEVEDLYANKDLNALQTVGYREIFSFFEGEFDLTFAIEEIKKNTRRFAKRQMTWFKRNENTKWFDYKTNISEIINYINLQLK
ncbi:tRNA (adenosine(37)-N6)-dimethylallyltransferase MiaA [Paenimyroides tangerinum]|uniref:tRNA dimethylallyltransferase n=1 Tax=Paenimyroides tangerinum TaxID=2488728 RepID=A0A3P3W528_9FLAO|nr:tRNA (adenosine(37)-N6)-dimethylallyltransferase MiaA [Paenimyroides tangerinum]RRJ89548.1 tRNA (adenosine(37)-N6)-dimethylallyltransferase MiaA [Paenimyroides tangerinum]